MRHGKQIRPATRSVPDEAEAPVAVAAPPPGARPSRLAISRAGLLGLLVRVPAVCRSVGLVR
jgi:hypothetical protein